jgi:hypothetical protein
MAWVEAMPDDPGERDDDQYQQGLVDRIEDGVAIVLVGAALDEWDFPAHLLPDEAKEGTVLRLREVDGSYEVVDIDPSVKPLEERLDRGLNRKRPIVFPLPHREHTDPIDESDVIEIDGHERVSRLARGLHHP